MRSSPRLLSDKTLESKLLESARKAAQGGPESRSEQEFCGLDSFPSGPRRMLMSRYPRRRHCSLGRGREIAAVEVRVEGLEGLEGLESCLSVTPPKTIWYVLLPGKDLSRK